MLNLFCPICKSILGNDNYQDHMENRCINSFGNNAYHGYYIGIYVDMFRETYADTLKYNVVITHIMKNNNCTTEINANHRNKIILNGHYIDFYSETLDDDIKKLLLLL